jgi:hypothetical protein
MFTDTQQKAVALIWANLAKQFIYSSSTTVVDDLSHDWEPDSKLQPAELSSVKFVGICESYARVGLARCTAQGIKARLVVCYDELGEGHCICEVSDDQEQEAWYLDNRQDHLAVRDDLVKYKFLGVSPWNPKPGDTRPWMLVG